MPQHNKVADLPAPLSAEEIKPSNESMSADPPTLLSILAIAHIDHNEQARALYTVQRGVDRKSTRLNSSHIQKSRMPSSA